MDKTNLKIYFLYQLSPQEQEEIIDWFAAILNDFRVKYRLELAFKDNFPSCLMIHIFQDIRCSTLLNALSLNRPVNLDTKIEIIIEYQFKNKSL